MISSEKEFTRKTMHIFGINITCKQKRNVFVNVFQIETCTQKKQKNATKKNLQQNTVCLKQHIYAGQENFTLGGGDDGDI